MIKLFVVEDEIIMRNGLKSIAWEKEDIELVGDASDGELAYPMILETKPDIIITDIKMPFMDGLELSERVKKELPDIQIIILSGFDEFSYAQKAVSLGVTEYLLKPVTPEKLLESVNKVKEKLLENRKQEDDFDFPDVIPQEKNEIQKQRFFRHLVMNTKSSSELIDMADMVEINLRARAFCVILINVAVEGLSGSDYSQTRNAFKEQFVSYLADQNGWTLIDRGENGYALLVARNHEDSIKKTMEEVLGVVKNELDNIKGVQFFIAVGNIVNRVSEIKFSYEQATKAASYRFLTGPNQVIYASDLPTGGSEPADTTMDFNSAVTDKEYRDVLDKFMRTGTREELNPLVEEMFMAIGEQNIRSRIFMTYMLMDMYLAMLKFAKEMEIDTEEIDEKCGNIHDFLKTDFTPEASQNYLISYLEQIIINRDTKKEKRFNSALHDAALYIDNNFDKEDLSLTEVASIANISPSHFSAIFSQEFGVTFMEYLINKRMDKAKELLMTTEYRSSEIAYMVGYKDPHYFSHTFKKNLGMTPKEYRNRGEQ